MTSQASQLRQAISTLLEELVEGPPGETAYVLNPGDDGLLRSVERLSTEAASLPAAAGGASVAAHVDHVRFALELLNRWSRGENPFADADWSASWRRGVVGEAEWAQRIGELRAQATEWREAVRQPRELSDVELTGVIASVSHLAYHLGAIRQIQPDTRGPREGA
jgi:hypothetical protein